MGRVIAKIRAGSDRGLTLVELSVATMITSVIVVLAASLVIGMQSSIVTSTARQDQIDSARVAVESMSRTLRASVKPRQLSAGCGSCSEDAFLIGARTRVQFYSNIDNPASAPIGPSKVTYEVAASGAKAGELIEKIERPKSIAGGVYVYCSDSVAESACGAWLKSRTVAAGVVTAGTAPIFSYYSTAAEIPLASASSTLTAAQLESVLAIQVDVSVLSTGNVKPEPTRYIQRIRLPNAQAVIRLGEE